MRATEANRATEEHASWHFAVRFFETLTDPCRKVFKSITTFFFHSLSFQGFHVKVFATHPYSEQLSVFKEHHKVGDQINENGKIRSSLWASKIDRQSWALEAYLQCFWESKAWIEGRSCGKENAKEFFAWQIELITLAFWPRQETSNIFKHISGAPERI